MSKSNSELKDKYKIDFEKLRKLINEFDFCSFIEFGAPIDEYDNITNFLLSSIYKNISDEQIKWEIIDMLENYYEIGNSINAIEFKKNHNEIENLITKSKLEINKK